MIQVIKQPKEGAVFLSENPLEIEVKSTLGADYYFKVIIYEDGVLFDELGWSKYNDTNCKIDLKGMFSSIFQYHPVFEEDAWNDNVSYLNTPVKVTIKEYKRSDDSLVNTLDLNNFYVYKSEKKMFFDERINLQKMNNHPDVVRYSKPTLVRLPIWVNSGILTYQVLCGGVILEENTVTSFEFKIYELLIDISKYHLTDNVVTIFVTNNQGNTLIQKYEFNTHAYYDVTRVLFRNNFGLFVYNELFGTSKEEDTYNRKIYKVTDSIEFLAHTKVREKIKVNTGGLYPNEVQILKEINSSKEIYLLKENKIIPVIPVSKKSKGKDSDKDYVDDYIEFQVNGEYQQSENFKYD